MFLTKYLIFMLFCLARSRYAYQQLDGGFSSDLSGPRNGKSSDILRTQHLQPSPSSYHIQYVVQNAVLESITDLMLYWKRYKGVFLLDNHSGFWVLFLKNYLKNMKINADVHLINSTIVLEGLIEEIATERTDIVVLCNPFYTNSILTLAVQQNLFNRTVSWIIVGAKVPNPLLGAEIKINSQVTLVVPVIHSTIFGQVYFRDVFFGHETNKTESVKFASWSVARRLFVLEFLDHGDRHHGLYGRMSSGIVFAHVPFSMETHRENGSMVFVGYMLDVISMVVGSLNMQYTVRKIKAEYGIGVNGTFTGFLGMLNRKEADYSFNVLAMVPSRLPAVRFVGVTTKGFIGIFYNRPEPFMPPTAYFLPFSIRVWILTLTTSLVLIAAIAVAWFMSRVYFEDDHSGQLWSRSTFYKFVSGEFIVEVTDDPRGLLTKIFYGTLLVTCVLLFTYYTSVFTSFLTHREVDLPFVDLEGVVTNREYNVLLMRDTRYEDIMATATSGVYSDIWKKVMTSGGRDWFPTSVLEGYHVMSSGKYAFITEGISATYMSYDNCSVASTSKIYNKEYYFMVARHDFPFSSFIRLGLIRAMEGGIIARLSRQYKIESRPLCSTANTSSTLGLNQVVGVFVAWGCGIIISLLSLVLEMTVLRKYAN